MISYSVTHGVALGPISSIYVWMSQINKFVVDGCDNDQLSSCTGIDPQSINYGNPIDFQKTNNVCALLDIIIIQRQYQEQ